MNAVRIQTSDQDDSSPAPGRSLTFLEVARLLNRLHESGMLDSEFAFPEDWHHKREFSADEISGLIRGHLLRAGWQRLLEAFRYHNRQPDITLWDLSDASDFLAALEFAVAADEILIWEGKGKKHSRSMIRAIFDGRRIARLVHGFGQRFQAWAGGSSKPDPASGGAPALQTFVGGLSSAVYKARAKARADRVLDHLASYVTRVLGNDMEREAFLQRVNRLRSQMQEQLEVFCEEEGIPKPKPYSRGEAIYLNLLSAYFVAIAEAEERLRQHGNQLARQKIALEEQRVKARFNSEVLPELLAALQETYPIQEGLLREHIRHRIMLAVGSVATAVGSGLWSLVESVFEVFITGIARFAPIVAPPMLVGLITLVVQTMQRGFPLTLADALLFFGNALWNAILALGITLLSYGCWLYFTKRGKAIVEPAPPSTPIQVDSNGSQATAHMAQ